MTMVKSATVDQSRGVRSLAPLGDDRKLRYARRSTPRAYARVRGTGRSKHRGKHPLLEFDSSGKFIRSIADDLFVTPHSNSGNCRQSEAQPENGSSLELVIT